MLGNFLRDGVLGIAEEQNTASVHFTLWSDVMEDSAHVIGVRYHF
jgi:hypothetical protein